MAIRYTLSMPFIYGMIIPFLILDICIEIYHRICFPLFGIPYVSRKKYIFIDRQKLSYLAWYDKINCAYCGYGNGLLAFASAVAGATEQYWCGIKHQEKKGRHAPAHHKEFISYGDKKAYKDKQKGK